MISHRYLHKYTCKRRTTGARIRYRHVRKHPRLLCFTLFLFSLIHFLSLHIFFCCLVIHCRRDSLVCFEHSEHASTHTTLCSQTHIEQLEACRPTFCCQTLAWREAGPLFQEGSCQPHRSLPPSPLPPSPDGRAKWAGSLTVKSVPIYSVLFPVCWSIFKANSRFHIILPKIGRAHV